jgi:hypothetical protein
MKRILRFKINVLVDAIFESLHCDNLRFRTDLGVNHDAFKSSLGARIDLSCFLKKAHKAFE